MTNPDRSPMDGDADGAERQQQAGPPAQPTGPLGAVPAWRKALWVLAVLYGVYLIVTALVG